MELREVINKRRSIRKFKDADIPNELIEEVIDCARLAPSAKNEQPWKFLIANKILKDEIANIMELKINNSEEKINIKEAINRNAQIIKEAPILILVLKENNIERNIEDCLSIGAAIEHICLRATDLGLGSLWIRSIKYAQKEIEKVTEIENSELISAIAIGYPAEDPKPKKRKELNEILIWK